MSLTASKETEWEKKHVVLPRTSQNWGLPNRIAILAGKIWCSKLLNHYCRFGDTSSFFGAAPGKNIGDLGHPAPFVEPPGLPSHPRCSRWQHQSFLGWDHPAWNARPGVPDLRGLFCFCPHCCINWWINWCITKSFKAIKCH